MCPGLSYRLVICTLLGALTLPARLASAAFEIIDHRVFADSSLQETTFAITFNQSPDFLGVDEFGNPNHAFQYFYDTEVQGGEIGFDGEDVVIIRGSEIRFDDRLPVRESLNPTGEAFPNAEGWGKQRGEADFLLDGPNLTFAVGWDVLGEADGQFGYRLFALERGALTTETSQVMVPLPPAVIPGVVAIAIALTCVHVKKIRAQIA